MGLFRRRTAGCLDSRSWAEIRFERVRPDIEIAGGGDEPCVAVLLPRTGLAPLDWLLARLGAKDHRLRLDAIGTFVWQRLDGHRPVEVIGRDLVERFGDRVEPVEQTLVAFLRSLLKAGAIRQSAAGDPS